MSRSSSRLCWVCTIAKQEMFVYHNQIARLCITVLCTNCMFFNIVFSLNWTSQYCFFILKKKLLKFLLPKPFLILYKYIYNFHYEMSKWMLVSFYFIFVPAWKCHFLFLSDLKGKVNIDYYYFFLLMGTKV